MNEFLPRTVAGRSLERVLKLARETLDAVPTSYMDNKWNDDRETTISDLDEILSVAWFDRLEGR
jgi:hypothetical protein